RQTAEQGPWQAAEAWCRQSWDRCGSPPNPGFRQVLRELTWFARCCASPAGRALLERSSRTTPLPEAAVAGHALRLPRASSVGQLRFEDLPAGPGATVPEPLTADFLRAALPLVRRVPAEARLPPDLWDVSGDQNGTPFLLLDFPGLGADESGVRDSFLCDRELREVQTILVVLNGSRIGSDVGAVLFAKLQAGRPGGQDLRDNILVGIHGFGQLSGGPPDRPETIREDSLQATAPVLHAALVSADNVTTRRDRVVLLCALAALDALAGAGRAVGSDRFLTSTSTGLSDWHSRARQAWHRVAERLFEVDPRSVLARQLRELVADGGLARLKTLLVDHVSQHGLRQLHDRVRDLALRLRRACKELPKRSTADGNGRLTAEGVKECVRKLRQEYVLVQREFRMGPGLRVRHEEKERPIEDVAASQVCKHVWDWPVWKRLLNRIEQGKFRQTRT